MEVGRESEGGGTRGGKELEMEGCRRERMKMAVKRKLGEIRGYA